MVKVIAMVAAELLVKVCMPWLMSAVPALVVTVMACGVWMNSVPLWVAVQLCATARPAIVVVAVGNVSVPELVIVAPDSANVPELIVTPPVMVTAPEVVIG